MDKSNKWINLQDISMWKNSWYDAMMYSDLQGIQIAFSNAEISLDKRVYLLARSEWFNPTLLVRQENSGRVFLVVVGDNPYAINLLQENDEHLILDGELNLEDISWIPKMKIVVFYKHYIVRNEYQKVVVGYESELEYWIKEETIRDEKYMIETHRIFNFDDSVDSHPWKIPEDW